MDLTVKDAARLLHTSEKSLYRWIHEGSIPFYRVSDKYRLNRVELLEWASRRQMPVSPEIFSEEQSPLPQRLLSDAMRRGGVLADVAATDKRSVLRAVCQTLPLPASVNREELFGVLLAREAMASTGIGNGLAIPHPRSPIVLGVSEPQVTIAHLGQPIDFASVDGKPVSTLFVIISTTVRLHLQILSRLMFVLQNADFRKVLRPSTDAAELHRRVQELEANLRHPAAQEGAVL